MIKERVFIALGANLGDVLESFRAAIRLLAEQGIQLEKCSSAYQTPALVEKPSEVKLPDYWNAVVEVRTSLDPDKLLHVMQSIENQLGRIRNKRWESRTIDLDIVLFGGRTIDSEVLNVPHPEMHRRVFVLEPLSEIAGEFSVPGHDKSVSQLLSQLPRSANNVLEKKKDWL